MDQVSGERGSWNHHRFCLIGLKSNAGLSYFKTFVRAMGEFIDGKPTVQRFKQVTSQGGASPVRSLTSRLSTGNTCGIPITH
jgi:hypothetical protein